jgi:hypothetical protein
MYAGSLMEGRRAEVPTVGEAPGGHDVQVVDDGIARAFGLDLVRPGRTWAQYETMLDQQGVQYALVGETGDDAMVASCCATRTGHPDGPLTSLTSKATGAGWPAQAHAPSEPRLLDRARNWTLITLVGVAVGRRPPHASAIAGSRRSATMHRAPARSMRGCWLAPPAVSTRAATRCTPATSRDAPSATDAATTPFA